MHSMHVVRLIRDAHDAGNHKGTLRCTARVSASRSYLKLMSYTTTA